MEPVYYGEAPDGHPWVVFFDGYDGYRVYQEYGDGHTGGMNSKFLNSWTEVADEIEKKYW